MTLKDQHSFIEDLVNHFPEIKDEVLDDDWTGLITLQIGCFMRFTQKAIDTNDITTIKNCFWFVDDNLDAVEFNVENSLTISWLGKLDFAKNKVAFDLLSTKLKNLYTQLRQWNTDIPKNQKLNTFLHHITKNKH